MRTKIQSHGFSIQHRKEPMNIRLTIITVLTVCTALWAMPSTARGQTPTLTPTPTLQGGSLFASVNLGGTCGNGGGSIFQYTAGTQAGPSPAPSIFASNLAAPRGLVFDSAGNLYVATNSADDSCNTQGTIFKITPDGLMSTFAAFPPRPFPLCARHRQHWQYLCRGLGKISLAWPRPPSTRSVPAAQ
jgi:hypothetical protein